MGAQWRPHLVSKPAHPGCPSSRPPLPWALSLLSPSLRGPGLGGVKQQPQGHTACGDAGVGAQVSPASPGLSQPGPCPEGFIPGPFDQDGLADPHGEALGLLCHQGMGRGLGDTVRLAVGVCAAPLALTQCPAGSPTTSQLAGGVADQGQMETGACLAPCLHLWTLSLGYRHGVLEPSGPRPQARLTRAHSPS